MVIKKIFKIFGITISILLFLFTSMVIFKYFRAVYQPINPSSVFLKITTQKVDAEPSGSWYDSFGKIKLSKDIPQFKNISPSERNRWDSIAKELMPIEAKLNNSRKSTLQSHEARLTEEIEAKLNEKREAFTREINKDITIQKINSEIDVIEKEYYPLRLEYSSFHKTKIAPLENKKFHISMGAPGSIRSYLFWSVLPIIIVEPLEALYKKTRAYKEVEQQILKLREEEKNIENKMQPYKDKINQLIKQKNTRTTIIVEKSKYLKSLKSEIEVLEKKYSEVWDKYIVRQERDLAKNDSLIKDFTKLRNKLHKLFDEIVFKYKIIK